MNDLISAFGVKSNENVYVMENLSCKVRVMAWIGEWGSGESSTYITLVLSAGENGWGWDDKGETWVEWMQWMQENNFVLLVVVTMTYACM